MGVTYEKGRNKFRAVYYRGGKAIHVGRYDTKLKATRALNKARNEHDTITPLKGEGFKNVGMNGRGEIVPHRTDAEEEARFETEFNKLRPSDVEKPFYLDDDEPIDRFELHTKPSFTDRIKSIWRSIRQQS